jgi:hypothetical protein
MSAWGASNEKVLCEKREKCGRPISTQTVRPMLVEQVENPPRSKHYFTSTPRITTRQSRRFGLHSDSFTLPPTIIIHHCSLPYPKLISWYHFLVFIHKNNGKRKIFGGITFAGLLGGVCAWQVRRLRGARDLSGYSRGFPGTMASTSRGCGAWSHFSGCHCLFGTGLDKNEQESVNRLVRVSDRMFRATK